MPGPRSLGGGGCSEKVVVFVDGTNFHHQVRDFCGKSDSSLDYHALGSAIAGDRELVRIYYYSAPIDRMDTPKSEQLAKAQQKFFSHLRNTPYVEVRLGRMVRKGGSYVQKGVDVAMAVDMLGMAYKDRYDAAVLLSADSDLVSAVQNVKDLGKHVELGLCSTTRAFHLAQVCDRTIALDPILARLLP